MVDDRYVFHFLLFHLGRAVQREIKLGQNGSARDEIGIDD